MAVLNSRRLWTFILSSLVSIATLLIGHYFQDPFAMQVSILVVSTVEGVAGILITAYTVDDINARKADKEIQLHAITNGVHPDYPVTSK